MRNDLDAAERWAILAGEEGRTVGRAGDAMVGIYRARQQAVSRDPFHGLFRETAAGNDLLPGVFPLGACVYLATARGWARGRLALPAAALVWASCVLLPLRGGAGVIDDLTRATGLLPNELTGLSTKDTTGVADLRWSGWAIDIYFLAGGIIFGLLAVHYRAQQARTHGDARPACRSQMVSRL